MSDEARTAQSEQAVDLPQAASESTPEPEQQPDSGSAIDGAASQLVSATATTADSDEQPDAVDQPTISLHEQPSPRSPHHTNHPYPEQPLASRPVTSPSVLRPVSAFSLPVDPRFPSDPSPQLLAVLQAADEADRLAANSRSPLLTERKAAAGIGSRPETATQLGGGLDTLQGLPSQPHDYAEGVVQSKMRWREATRAERAARVERRRDELLAELEAETKASFSSPPMLKSTALPHVHSKMNSTKPMLAAVAVS